MVVLLLLFFLVPLSSTTSTESRLNFINYDESCPRIFQIVKEIVTSKQISTPTSTAGTRWQFFYDCLHNGCEASVLFFCLCSSTTSTSSFPVTRAFDLVVRAKTAVELVCPDVVPCSDILALAVLDLVFMLGGPRFNFPLGRRDGMSSSVVAVARTLPLPSMFVSER